jgi:hypothetical protein
MCPLVEGAVQVEKNRTIIADSFRAVNDRAKRVAPTIHVVLARWRAIGYGACEGNKLMQFWSG